MATLNISANGNILTIPEFNQLPDDIKQQLLLWAGKEDNGLGGFNFVAYVANADGSPRSKLVMSDFQFALITGWAQPSKGTALVLYAKEMPLFGIQHSGFYRLIVAAKEPGMGPSWWFILQVKPGADLGMAVILVK